MSARRCLLAVSGGVALAAASHQALRGSAGVHGAGPPRADLLGDRNLDSELRFYAVWYGVAGLQMLRAASDPDADPGVEPLLAAGWGAAALSRLLSVRAVGRPSRRFVALAAAEAALAAAMAATRGRR